MKPATPSAQLPVLGLFKDEDDLRDHLAANLGLIEPGLKLKKKNAPVQTLHGADGVLDILAEDAFGAIVIIEIKRSDEAARQALHELSKYVAGFLTTVQIDMHKVRCFVISSHWHELDTPLAFFRGAVPVDVKGFQVTAPHGVVQVNERVLPPIDVLPKLCPDTRLLQAKPGVRMSSVIADLKKAVKSLPDLRMALLQFQAAARQDDLAVLCIWRIADDHFDSTARVIGASFGDETQRAYIGWAEESSVLDWMTGQCDKLENKFLEMQMGTPENITAILEKRSFDKLVPLGAWPKHDLVHDLAEMQRCLVAQDVSPSGRRANKYFFNARSSPRTGLSWEYTAAAFTSFVGFDELWRREVQRFLKNRPPSETVVFYAQDMGHFYYRIYQRLEGKDAHLHQFTITVLDASGTQIRRLIGAWAWDGRTCPTDAVEQLKATYGSLDASRTILFSKTDERRYESAYRAHGFCPVVLEYDPITKEYIEFWEEPRPAGPTIFQDIEFFIEKNPDYCSMIADSYRFIPAAPDGTRLPAEFELTGE